MISVGDIISFGFYDQKCIAAFWFLHEPIEWIVLEVQESEAVLLSLKGLESGRFDSHHSFEGWENSSLREMLNDDFISGAFSPEQLKLLVRSKIETVGFRFHNNRWNQYREQTEDFVYVLSKEEFFRYEQLFNDNGLMDLWDCKATGNALFPEAEGNWPWYLRSGDEHGVDIVRENKIESYPADAYDGDYPCAVRPVIRIRLDVGYDFSKVYGKTLIECNEPITHIDLVDNGATFL